MISILHFILLHSPLLKESLLLSFPPLNNMFKFSGLSLLIWVFYFIFFIYILYIYIFNINPSFISYTYCLINKFHIYIFFFLFYLFQFIISSSFIYYFISKVEIQYVNYPLIHLLLTYILTLEILKKKKNEGLVEKHLK